MKKTIVIVLAMVLLPLYVYSQIVGGIVGGGSGGYAVDIEDGLIVNADINASAAIDATKVADGTVTSAEFQYIGGLTSDAQDQIDAQMTSAEHTTLQGAAYDTEAELKKLMSVSQSVSVANAAALTPTPGYKWLDVSLNCEDATTSIGTGGVTLVETGMITDAYIKISNTSTGADDGNVCTFAYVAGNVEWPGGSGLTISMEDGESMILHFEADRYKVIVNNTSTQWISGLASKTPVAGATASFAGTFTGANLYGGTYIATSDNGDLVLPVMAAGMNFTIVTKTAIEVVIDPNAADDTTVDGTDNAVGHALTNLSTAGDIAYLQYRDADGWLVTTNGWTLE